MGVKAKRSLALFVCVLIAVALSAFVLSVAFADDGYVADEDDSPGPFDIERFGFFQEETGGHLTLDLYGQFDPTLLDDSLNWIGFILEDDIADGYYERAVFLRNKGDYWEASLYRDGRTGSDPGTFIENVSFQIVDSNTVDVIIPKRQYAPFHHWYAQTAFETIGQDDRGYPECTWGPSPPPRPFPPMAKCIDETNGLTPTFDSSPTITDSGGPPTPPPCEYDQSDCRKTWVSIHYRESIGDFHGRVFAKNNLCVGHRRVALLRVLKSGETEVLDADRTTGRGHWRIPFDAEDGSYRVRAPRFVYDNGGLKLPCKRVVSITIQP